jgi:gliding motility-associated lipoprotein GldH
MKKSFIYFTLIGCITQMSCNDARYKESHDEIFKDQIWSKNEIITFEPTIEDNQTTRDIVIDLQHIMGYNINGFDINMLILGPDGNEILNKNYYLKMKHEDGSYISSCSGDYCDLTQTLEKQYHFATSGKHTIKISQATTANDVAGFLKLRLTLP